jgi:pimeloyl-ACP methyl ester carboxylesterase
MQSLYLPEFDAHLCYHDLPGQEPACVYLHGIGSASSADFPHIPHYPGLAPYRALLIDLLGFGFSDRPAAFSHTFEAHAEVVARLLDHLGLRRCHVIGHSMSGTLAIVFAAARRDLVSGLVVSECNLEPEDATFSREILEQSATEEDYVAAGHADVIARAEGWAAAYPVMGFAPGVFRAADPRAMYRCAAALIACHLKETFFGLDVPRTYVFGAKSLPHRHESLLAAGGVPMPVVPEAGHMMMCDNPEAYAAILAGTLSGREIPVQYRHEVAPASAAARLAEVAPKRKA